jgi:hypothetical protein
LEAGPEPTPQVEEEGVYIHFTPENREDFPPVDFSTYNTIRKAWLAEIALTTRLKEELKTTKSALKTLKEKYNE